MRTLFLLILSTGALAQGDGVAELISELRNEDPYVRRTARHQLAQMGANAVPDIAARLKDADAAFAVELALVLGEIGPKAEQGVPALMKLLTRPDKGADLAAARALGGIGPGAHKAVDKLIAFGRAKDWSYRFAARDALVGIGEASLAPLLRAWAAGDASVGAWADSVFRGLGARAVPDAVRLLASDAAQARATGADALAAIGPNAHVALPALIGALRDKTGLVRRRAALALGALGPQATDAIPDLVALARDKERRAELQAIEALGHLARDAGANARRRSVPARNIVNAIDLGLKWLADHQDADGKWNCANFPRHDPAGDKTNGKGKADHTIGVTGLALLAFLEAEPQPPLDDPIRPGLRYLVSIQDRAGNFGIPGQPLHNVYNHATATLAMCAGWHETRDPIFGRSAQRALNVIVQSRNEDLAWRYVPRDGNNDTSVTGWMIASLMRGQLAGLRVDRRAFAGGLAWIEAVTNLDDGRAGYMHRLGKAARPTEMNAKFPPDKTRSMTAESLLVRLCAGERPGRPEVFDKSVGQCLDLLPVWNPDTGVLDMYYWYQATMALYHVGGRPWFRWAPVMRKVALDHQRPKGSGARTGSWDPIGPWGRDGGRVYSTALMVLCLDALAGWIHKIELPFPKDAALRPAIKLLKSARKHESDSCRNAASSALDCFGPR